jgi:catechol 2,3-dioxygenase-like lactoylglutathione lyase family enzyme
MFQGLEHLGIASPDPDRLAKWYVERLGFVVVFYDLASRTSFVKAPNGSMFEIIAAEGEAAPVKRSSPGLRHMAITVDDFETDYASLKLAGVTFLAEPVINSGSKVVFFEDPDGNILHLIERPNPLG